MPRVTSCLLFVPDKMPRIIVNAPYTQKTSHSPAAFAGVTLEARLVGRFRATCRATAASTDAHFHPAQSVLIRVDLWRDESVLIRVHPWRDESVVIRGFICGEMNPC